MDATIYIEAILTDTGPTTAKAASRWLTSQGITVDFAGTGAYSISAHCSKEIFDKLNRINPCEHITLLEPQGVAEFL